MHELCFFSLIEDWEDVFLVRELLLHQGRVRHQGHQDDRVDGPHRDGHRKGGRNKKLFVKLEAVAFPFKTRPQLLLIAFYR